MTSSSVGSEVAVAVAVGEDSVESSPPVIAEIIENKTKKPIGSIQRFF
jgi:hypothetical protein